MGYNGYTVNEGENTMFDLPEWLYEHLMKMEKPAMLEVLWEALDHMQAWNGRTQTYCVAMACPDIEVIDGDNGAQYRIGK